MTIGKKTGDIILEQLKEKINKREGYRKLKARDKSNPEYYDDIIDLLTEEIDILNKKRLNIKTDQDPK